ncbi:MAG: zinc-dependent metalloprotease [Planctomycetota bacterium]|jgi:hypothetical protein
MWYKKNLIVAVLLCACIPVQAQQAPPKPTAKAKPDKATEPVKPKKEYPDFKEVTKDMREHKGLFTLWYYPKDAKGKDKEKLLCQIPAKFLGQNFMLSTSFSGGGFFTGFPLDERAVKWQEFGKKLLLIEPETRFFVNEKSTVSDVVRRTHPDRIHTAVPIVTKSSAGDPVIELGPLLKSDFANIGWTLSLFVGPQPGKRAISTELSKWKKKKTFPGNVEICVELAISRPQPPGSYEKKLVHYSFWELKKTDYKPRLADDRVGYFLTTNRDWSKPTDKRDIFNRYIDRWQLEKRDPTLKRCEPVKPITFYIEKTVPVRFRHAIRDGILEWNKAFEKVGFLNAIQVRQQTDDNEWKNLDPEDMRYSFFRWIVTGYGFAMGPHRANPFTGQIYDADIVFDDSMVRYFEREAERMLPSTAIAMKMNNPVLRAFLEEFPQWHRPFREWGNFSLGERTDVKFREAMQQHVFDTGYHCCDYMEAMKHQMAVAGVILAGQPKEVIDRFLYDVIKEVACHEVGHTLGLRHNFAASHVYSLEEIKKRRKTGGPTAGSVMDYNPVLFFKDKPVEGYFITPTLGPYDHWAIEYGYRPYDAKSAAKEKKDQPKKPKGDDSYLSSLTGEQKMLHEIAARAAEPQLLYATDEDTMWIFSPDPRSNYVGRYAGGQYFHRGHRGDPNAPPPFEIVDAQLQRRALNFVVENLFEDDFFVYPPKLLNYMAPSRWWHEGIWIDMNFFIMDFPIRDYIRFMQWWHLFDRLFPYTLRRIHDAEMKTTDPEKFTVAEYLQTIRDACWKQTHDVARAKKGTWTPNNPFVSDIRRSLQREYLDLMERLVRTRPGWILSPDLHAMVWCSLEELGQSLDEVLKASTLDFASRAHLKTSKSRIDRMLAPELQEW